MNLGITLARTGNNWEVVTGPEVPFSVQSRALRDLRKMMTGSADELQLWSSSQGRVFRHRLGRSPVTQPELQLDSSTTGEASEESAANPAEQNPAPVSSIKSGSKSAGKAKGATKAGKSKS